MAAMDGNEALRAIGSWPYCWRGCGPLVLCYNEYLDKTWGSCPYCGAVAPLVRKDTGRHRCVKPEDERASEVEPVMRVLSEAAKHEDGRERSP